MNTGNLVIFKRYLPHWRIEGSVYFVTWSLQKNQVVLLPQERDLIQDILLHFDRIRYRIFAYVVMNDHVHILVSPKQGWQLSQITHSWKSFSSNQLQREFARQGSIWLRESFDRMIRNDAEFIEKGEYILTNLFRRWSDLKDYPWVGTGREVDRPGRNMDRHGGLSY